jgi:hypothetical protein
MRKKDNRLQKLFSGVEGPPSESSSDTEMKQILTRERSDQTQKWLENDREKQSLIEGISAETKAKR